MPNTMNYVSFGPSGLYKSSDGRRNYQVSVHILESIKRQRLELSCNCMGWTRKVHHGPEGDYRSCKHTKDMNDCLSSGIMNVPQEALDLFGKLGAKFDFYGKPSGIVVVKAIVANILTPCCGHMQEHDFSKAGTCAGCGESFVI